MSRGGVIVAGAGPAGLCAALAAASLGARVKVMEALDRAGAKLVATGGGRCNLTNLAMPEDYYHLFGQQGRFMTNALELLPPQTTVRMFEELGVRVSVENGRAWPSSNRASEVRDALLLAAEGAGVEIITGKRLERIVVEGDAVCGALIDGRVHKCSAIVLATGGLARADLGSRGDGFALARETGHCIVEPVPALVPLVAEERWPGRLAGIALPDAVLRIKSRGRNARAVRGETLFTHTGLSGPVVLDVSGHVARLLARSPVAVELAPVADASRADWEDRLADTRFGAGSVAAALAREMPSRLAETAAKLAGIDPGSRLAGIGRKARAELASLLAGMPVTITSTAGFSKAMATSGGVSLKEIDPRGMASRLVRGLFFAGEVVDLDGPCGGFNLQWAFSSGTLAGSSAVSRGRVA